MALSKAPATSNSCLGTNNTFVLTVQCSVFPVKVHQMLHDAEKSGHDDIVSWMPDGKSFKIHDRARFVRFTMPSYFGTCKFRSFQRNLNLWNFKVANTFPHKGEISHSLFVRDSPDLCGTMKRDKVKNKKPQEVVVSRSISLAEQQVEQEAATTSTTRSADDLAWEFFPAQVRSVQHSPNHLLQAAGLSGWSLPKVDETPSNHHVQQQVVEEALMNLVYAPARTARADQELLLATRLHLLRATLGVGPNNTLSPAIASFLQHSRVFSARGA
jgi:hypothetical protein